MDSSGDVRTFCRICGLSIEIRHPIGGSSTNLGHWVHEATKSGDGADKDHDAVR